MVEAVEVAVLGGGPVGLWCARKPARQLRTRAPRVASALQDNTLAQLALFSRFDPPMLRLRQVLDEVLRFPDVNRRLAQDITGFGVNYPEPLDTPPEGWQHVDGVSGHRLRDLPVTLQDGTVTFACDLLKHGQWICLQLTPDTVPLDDPRTIQTIHTVHGGDDFYPDLAALLVRPDGYVSHVRLMSSSS